MFFMFVLGMVLYGTTVLIPQFLQLLMGYSAVSAGEALAGGGFIMMLMMPISGMLVSKVDQRALMSVGFATTAAALYYMATHMTSGHGFPHRVDAARLPGGWAWRSFSFRRTRFPMWVCRGRRTIRFPA